MASQQTSQNPSANIGKLQGTNTETVTVDDENSESKHSKGGLHDNNTHETSEETELKADKLKLQNRLKDEYGLDHKYWSEVFERELGLTNTIQLKYLNDGHLNKLQSSIRNDLDNEALKQIIKDNLGKDESENDAPKRTAKEVSDEFQPDNNNFKDEIHNTVRSLTSALEPGESWKTSRHDLDLDTKLKNLQPTHSSRDVKTTQLTDREVLSHSSSSCALRGIHLNQCIDSITEMKGIVIDIVGDVIFQGPSMKQEVQFVEFSSREKSDTFQRSLQTTGKNARLFAHIGFPIFSMKLQGSFTSMKNIEDTNTTSSEEFYQSREKYAFVPVKSYEFKIENIHLISNAIKTLQAIESGLQGNAICMKSLSQCKKFFQIYGSHINMGILHFGGVFKWKASYSSSIKSSNNSRKELVNDTLDGFTSMGYTGPGPAIGIGVSGKYLSGNSSIVKNHTEEELSKVQLNIDPIGGPHDETDYGKWVQRLTTENGTWSLISRGEFIGIWEVLKNHKTDFYNVFDLADFMQCAWNMEIFESCLDTFELTDFSSILPTLRQSIDRLIDLTQDDGFFKSLVESNVKVQHFFEQVAFSDELQDQMQCAKMQHEISLLLSHLKYVFLKDRPTLMLWIAKVNAKFQDLPSALSTESIEDIDTFMSVLKTKFLPEIEDMATMERHRSQQTAELYITSEMTTVCHRILIEFKSKNVREFVILMSILSRLRFDETCGFPQLLSESDLKTFIAESEQIIHEFNNLPKKSKVQDQACLIDFIVKNITRNKSKSFEKIFIKCVHALEPVLENDIKSAIGVNTEKSPYNWLQLQDDLLPFINGTHTNRKMYSLPKFIIKQNESGQKGDIPITKSSRKTVQDKVKNFLTEMRMPSTVNVLDSVTIDERTTNKKKQNLLWFLLQKIMTQHSSIYKILEEHVQEFQNENKRKAADDFDIFDDFEEDDNVSTLNENDNLFENLNALDLMVALFLCSSETLKQALASKMYTCRLAVPLVLPDEYLTAPSVSFFNSVFISTSGNKQIPAADCPCNILSFIRVGCPKVSKSKIINDIISNENHDVFLNYCSPFGRSKRTIGEGLIEATFFNPYLKSEKGRNCEKRTMILNLRGDGSCFKEQLNILSHLSSGVVVFITIESLESDETQKLLQTFYSSKSTVALMIDAQKRSKENVKQITDKYKDKSIDHKKTKFGLISIDGQERKSADIKNDIDFKFQDLFSKVPTKSLTVILGESKIVLQNDFSQRGQRVTRKIKELLDSFTSTFSIKRDVLPMQGDILNLLSKNMKRLYKPSEYKSPKHKVEIKQAISSLRMEQVKRLSILHPLMHLFLETVLNYLQFDEEELINFALWLKVYLEKLTRENMSVCHAKYIKSVEKLKAAKQSNSNEAEAFKEKVANDELNFLAGQLGFEHFIREMGQVYEATADQESRVSVETKNLVKRFPCIPAKLLLAGVPFEVMNGDLIHVPIVWVKAVLNEVAELICDRKCLVVSVVGIQSSGKSTLLNTMFGLQFPVGHGRVTKGAFMQLIPVHDEKLDFEFIIVIDTEGLRAPELGHENYQHDNEFATFIMGIADINIVNINGESQGEMKEVLQMVVHALLKMKTASDSLNLKQSCVFIHQNVKTEGGIDSALEYNIQHMINTLDEMTAEAADQLDISDINCFNQVIDFDQKYVWYLPNFSTGEQPVTRISPSYSAHITTIKETIIYDIARKRQAYFSLKDTASKIEDIWNGILTEDFAFSFKNNLEAKAFTKLDKYYQELYWGLESKLYNFVREKRCFLLKCKSESEFDGLIATVRNNLPEFLINEFEKTKNEFDEFIERHTLKNIMLKWKQGYSLKLQTSLKPLSDRSDREVELIQNEIKQFTECEKAIKKCEDEINSYATTLAEEFNDSNETAVSENILHARFDEGWLSWIAKCSTTPVDAAKEPDEVFDEIKRIVRKNIYGHGNFYKELDDLTINDCIQMSNLYGLVVFNDIHLDSHITIKKSLLTGCMTLEKPAVCINQTVDFTDKLFLKIETYLTKLRFQDVKFNAVFMSHIMKMVESEITQHNDHKDNDHKFRLKAQYKAMILTKIAAYSTKEFIDINRQYDQKHNPRIKLEEYKETALKLFVDLVQKKTEDVIAGNFFQKAIKSSVLEQIDEILPSKVEAEIWKSFEYSKYNVIKSVMKDLIDKNSFDHLSVYITSPASFVEIWLLNYTNKCLFERDGQNVLNYKLLSKFIVENAIEDVISSVNNAADKIKGKFGDRISAWIDEFITSSKLLPITKEKLKHVGKRNVTDIENFRRTVLKEISSTKESLLKIVTDTTQETIRWKKEPYTSIFERLWGCCATCPFCSEPCEYNDNHLDSVKHSCKQHRPQGVGEYAWENGSGELVTDICNHLIHESRKDFILSDSNTTHKYKHYRTKFPDWEITPIYKPSKYWMWYFKTFKNEIAKKSNTKVPELPENWNDVTAEDAKNSL